MDPDMFSNGKVAKRGQSPVALHKVSLSPSQLGNPYCKHEDLEGKQCLNRFWADY